jgi:hypothetical protein
MSDPKPCPMCNSPIKFDATGASEMYGKTWQTLYIMCSKQNNPHCCMSLDLESDADYIEYAADALVECWNKLRSKT